jgi:hypothetical protein
MLCLNFFTQTFIRYGVKLVATPRKTQIDFFDVYKTFSFVAAKKQAYENLRFYMLVFLHAYKIYDFVAGKIKKFFHDG